MKMHKLEVYVFDFENSGLENVVASIENNRHYCISVKESQTADIGKWDDDHILNKSGTPLEVFRSYFGTPLKPCKSPYCECGVGKCTHPGFYDARGE